SYRVDRIQGASVTSQTFVPRYAIELTPAGPLVAPMTESRAAPAMPVARRSRSSAYAPVHVFRCSLCGKRFERKTYDATLRSHKIRTLLLPMVELRRTAWRHGCQPIQGLCPRAAIREIRQRQIRGRPLRADHNSGRREL